MELRHNLTGWVTEAELDEVGYVIRDMFTLRGRLAGRGKPDHRFYCDLYLFRVLS